MDADHIFISHATRDDEFVKQLPLALEGQGLSLSVDSRNLRGGDKLAPGIQKPIEEARQIIVVLSPNTINSPWARREIQKALQVEKQHKDERYRVVALLLPGVEPRALGLWFMDTTYLYPYLGEPTNCRTSFMSLSTFQLYTAS